MNEHFNKFAVKFLTDPIYTDGINKTKLELTKKPLRYEIINYLLKYLSRKTNYLEIGVRNPEKNFDYIQSDFKYGVDPGIEFTENPVDFKMTSDTFFDELDNNKILNSKIKFDVIFIDGLHLAEQVDKDIINSLKYIKDDGFIVLHDCNPPTEWHAREQYNYHNTPAQRYWNGTTWKAFFKYRFNSDLHSCCIDSDWGVGILSKKQPIGQSIEPCNFFFEFNVFDANRKEMLNLIEFSELKNILK